MTAKRIDIWHNILWSRYKGVVFSALYAVNDPLKYDIRFFQMAETEGNRTSLSNVDTSYHTYPYTLLFKGSLGKTGFINRLKVLVNAAKTTDADLCVLTGYERPEVWVQTAILKLRGKKVMFFCDSTIYDQPQNPLKYIIKSIIFRTADGIFGYGQRARDYVVGFGVKPEKWHRRCQAAALPHDYNADAVRDMRIKLAPPKEAPRYLYVGRLSPEKNLPRLLEAYVSIQKMIPAAKLIIVGGGKEQAELEEKARTLGLDPSAIFVGGKSGMELYDEYAKATCFVLPSLSEPWGLVVNEALHYGCPVVVSERCGCVPELVLNGHTGFSFNPTNKDEMAEKMIMAATLFTDISKTTGDCLDTIGENTPRIAAQQMLHGFDAVLK